MTVIEYHLGFSLLIKNPDIVQGFFSCMESVSRLYNVSTSYSFSHAVQFANHFVACFYLLPSELFNSLMQCAIVSLGLQERYSMVAGCAFIVSTIGLSFGKVN